ncbi:MAG: NGG1p interacting factor NIF3 [Candidatus Peregrinibacteria bacterium]|nr:NGG1p interacting factor NIF3 [Candidatus Peregrinibacteria bacterium]
MVATIQQIYDTMIKIGRKNDPRPASEVEAILKEAKESNKKLDKKKKLYFDEERMVNPYLDARVLYGDRKRKIKTAMVCIDADKSEIMLANELRKNGTPIDLVISHHPEGRALIDLTQVMGVQNDIMGHYGVSVNVAEKLLAKRTAQLDRGLHPINHYQHVDAARLLDIPFMTCHTPADNSVHKFITDFVKKGEKKWKNVGEFMEALLEIEELHEGKKLGMGPMVFAGSEKSKLGKIAVTGMTGGTSGSEDIYEQLSRAGVGTIVSMHMSEKPRELAEKHHLNVVITGHMPSDSIGMNLVMDHIEKQGVKLIPAGGFIRVKRKA